MCCLLWEFAKGRQTVMTVKKGREKDRVTHEERENDRKVLSPFPQTTIPGEAVSARWSSNQPSQWDNYIS